MVSALLAWFGVSTGLGVVANWTARRAAECERVMLEREGLAGFHFVAPQRWAPRRS